MLFILKKYITYLYTSKTEHGIHSPFIFDLVRNCFQDTTNYPEYKVLDNYRNALLNNHNTIDVTDFGAGSRVFKSNKREIAAIAKNAGITRKRAQLLFRLVRYFQPNEILEIGTSLGLATSAISLGAINGKITTLEGCPNTLAQSQLQFQKSKINSENINFVNSEFTTYLNNKQIQTSNFKLIYFDGNHSKKATLEYFETLLPTISNETIWIFDDIHWSEDMEQAWELIKNHPKVTVTIDTFQWGIVFFRKEQEKEHFILKINQTILSKMVELLRI